MLESFKFLPDVKSSLLSSELISLDIIMVSGSSACSSAKQKAPQRGEYYCQMY